MSFESRFQPRCPSCDMLVNSEESTKFLPFCSERCRLIDLGRWLNEEHTLPCEADEEEENEVDANAAQDTPRAAPRLPPGWHDA